VVRLVGVVRGFTLKPASVLSVLSAALILKAAPWCPCGPRLNPETRFRGLYWAVIDDTRHIIYCESPDRRARFAAIAAINARQGFRAHGARWPDRSVRALAAHGTRTHDYRPPRAASRRRHLRDARRGAHAHADRGYASFLRSQLDDHDAVIFVAEIDARVVGYVFAGLEPLSWKELRGPAGFIHDVVIDEAARGSGAGTALVDAAIAWLRDRGVPRVLLWTAEHNQGAQRLFERLGFRRTMIEMTREL
jgi:ribosomal protein S18 acetylase RimI-like enzyme